ncbi:amidase domain-containing protein [Pseudarthrobacter sp. NPDC089323]
MNNPDFSLPSNGKLLTRRLLLGSGLAVTSGVILGPSAQAAGAAGARYNRQKAVAWAKKNYTGEYKFKYSNCTYFVSQALWNGGLPKSPDWNSETLNPWKMADKKNNFGGPTKAAAHADTFKNYMKDQRLGSLRELSFGENNVRDVELGDIIFYDWDNGADGFVDHAMMVTGFSKDSNSSYKYPLLTGQSRSVTDMGWTWSKAKNGWIAENYAGKKDGARAYLLHITY